jgi:hypothetical protein
MMLTPSVSSSSTGISSKSHDSKANPSACVAYWLIQDYQEDLIFSEDKSKCLWYMGQGCMLLIDVENLRPIKEIKNFSGNLTYSHPDKTVIRKLVASKDLDWFVCLQIPENDEKSNVYLNHFDVKGNKQVSCVEYLTLNSRYPAK